MFVLFYFILFLSKNITPSLLWFKTLLFLFFDLLVSWNGVIWSKHWILIYWLSLVYWCLTYLLAVCYLEKTFKKPGIPPLLVVFSDDLNDQVCNNQNLKSSSINISLNCIWNPSDCLPFTALHLSKHHDLLQRLLMKEELNFPVFLVFIFEPDVFQSQHHVHFSQMIFLLWIVGAGCGGAVHALNRMFGRCLVSTL